VFTIVQDVAVTFAQVWPAIEKLITLLAAKFRADGTLPQKAAASLPLGRNPPYKQAGCLIRKEWPA
jgi:hypothetical protein